MQNQATILLQQTEILLSCIISYVALVSTWIDLMYFFSQLSPDGSPRLCSTSHLSYFYFISSSGKQTVLSKQQHGSIPCADLWTHAIQEWSQKQLQCKWKKCHFCVHQETWSCIPSVEPVYRGALSQERISASASWCCFLPWFRLLAQMLWPVCYTLAWGSKGWCSHCGFWFIQMTFTFFFVGTWGLCRDRGMKDLLLKTHSLASC